MNAHTPFDANQDWTNPYCQNSSNDPMVDALLGNAYHVVRTVYCNLGNLKLIYDFLNQYGMVLGVQSEVELKALTTKAKYARIYGFSRAGDRQVTDYLYVEGDRTGILPNDTTATGSWITVATSGSNGSGTSSGEGAYIPWVYANGSAAGGETTINVPDGTVGVPFIIVNGDMQYVGRGFEFNVENLSVTLAQPLEEGDEVVFLLTGTPAVPDNPNVNDWVQINWLYNNGAAVGGEQVIAIPYTFQSIPAVYKNGLRLYKGLTTESYTADPDNQRILLTEPLATNDRLIVQIGGEAQVLESSDHTLQEVARAANVKDSEVILSTDTTQLLNGKRIVYSVSEQKIYGLPTLPINVYIETVDNGRLTYSPGSITVDLLPTPSESLDKVNNLINVLTSTSVYNYLGSVPSVDALRSIEPTTDGEYVVVASHTDGYNLGGGIFRAVLDGSGKTDNNGTVIKTSGGSVWLRENKSEVYAVDFGFIPNDSTLATSNATAVVAAAKYAFDIGSVCVLPPDMAYVGDMIFNFPANIRGSHPGSGASLVQRNQTSDLIHTGSGYCFDFPPQLRPNVPADSQDVVDGICLTNINIRGTNSGLGGIRVNTAASISTVGYERRNTTFSNINIAGYYSGWGYQLFNTFTNHLFNVTVWDCAAIYYIRTSHSTDHVSCVYENCAWGCLAINTECNNHIGGAIEGVRYLPKMTKPVDYDENGNFPTDLGYSQLYAGIGIRTRGGTTLLSGVYIEANKIDMHLEDSCKVTARDCYFNAVSGRTEFNGIGTSGRLVVQGCRFVNAPSSGTRWRKNSTSLLCSHAIITQNQYDSLRPTSAPDIANVGEFDVYPGTPDLNAVTRVMKSQNTLTSGSTTSKTLSVDSTVVFAGLTTTVPTTTGQLYVDSTGVVKRKQ